MMKQYSYYDKILAINSSFVDALTNKAYVLLDLKRYDEAIKNYDKALVIQSIKCKCIKW